MDVHSLSLTRWREHAVSQAVSQIERGWLGDARVREMQQEYMFKRAFRLRRRRRSLLTEHPRVSPP